VHGAVRADNDAIFAVPAAGLNPVYRVDERVCAAIAGVVGVGALDVVVVAPFKELHEEGFDGLGAVNRGLGSNLQTAHLVSEE